MLDDLLPTTYQCSTGSPTRVDGIARYLVPQLVSKSAIHDAMHHAFSVLVLFCMPSDGGKLLLRNYSPDDQRLHAGDQAVAECLCGITKTISPCSPRAAVVPRSIIWNVNK